MLFEKTQLSPGIKIHHNKSNKSVSTKSSKLAYERCRLNFSLIGILSVREDQI